MRLTNQKGTILIVLVIAILMMAILGAGIYTISTSSSFSQLLANTNDNAYELARAGVRYGVLNIGSLNATPQTFYMPDANHLFQVSLDSNGAVNATGIVNQGSFWEARRTLTYNYDVPWAPNPSNAINQNDMNQGTPVTGGSSPGSAIQANMSNNTLNLGGNATDSYGSIWYQGSSDVGNCNNGACSLGAGLNVFFNFTFNNQDSSVDSRQYGDGFTFAIISATSNTRDRTGGAPNCAGCSAGELMGYAGPGTTSDGLGLKPPKMALQFDIYPNGAGNICLSGSRNDPYPNGNANNVSLMFWGARTPSSSSEPSVESAPAGGNCPTTNVTCTINRVIGQPCPDASFDDNVHGAGNTGNDPMNSVGPGDAGYYQFPGPGIGYGCSNALSTPCNWLEDGNQYSGRMEIVRPTGAASGTDSNGTYYYYQIKAWVFNSNYPVPAIGSANITDNQRTDLQNVTAPFSDFGPQINKYVKIYATDHGAFNSIFFGFTEATGAATQQITVANFLAFFPQTTCSSTTPTSISPTSAVNYPGSGAGGPNSIRVTQSSSCPWMASSTVPWITIRPSSGTGNTVIYTVTANNTGAARNGYINIDGAMFYLNQLVGPPAPGCTLAAAAPNNIVAYSGTTGLTWTVTNSPTSASWTTSPGGTCGVPNAANSSCTTGALTTPGANTYTLTVTNSGGSNSCSVTVNVGCANYRVWDNYQANNNARPFSVVSPIGSQLLCTTGLQPGSEITNTAHELTSSGGVDGHIDRYSSGDTGCAGVGTLRGSIAYTDAMNADIGQYGGNGICCVCYDNDGTGGAGSRSSCSSGGTCK